MGAQHASADLSDKRNGEYAEHEGQIEALQEVRFQADRHEEDGSENVSHELVEDRTRLRAHVRGIPNGDADQEGAEDSMDADGFRRRGAGQRQHEREAQHPPGPAQTRLDPRETPMDQPAADRQREDHDEQGQSDGRPYPYRAVVAADLSLRRNVGVHHPEHDGKDDPSNEIAEHRGSHDEHPDVRLEQIHVHHDLRDHGKRGYAQGRSEEEGEGQ